MKEPGLDNRHVDHLPKGGQIQQKRSDAVNGNLPQPIAGFSPKATVGTMRKVTGENSLAGIRRAAKGR